MQTISIYAKNPPSNVTILTLRIESKKYYSTMYNKYVNIELNKQQIITSSFTTLSSVKHQTNK